LYNFPKDDNILLIKNLFIFNKLTMAVIKIDTDKCIGCGRCTEICPDTFNLTPEGKAEVISEKDKDCALKASDQCPVGAIIVEE